MMNKSDKTRMKAGFLSLMLLVPLMAGAQNVFNGHVTDVSTNMPIAGAVVKLVQGESTKAFCVSDANGAYEMETKDGTKGEATLMFTHVSYEEENVQVSLESKKEHVVDMKMLYRSIMLKEVKVRAMPIRQYGDTLSYSLGTLLGKGDVSLEDGIKRIPGVDVSKNGAISYMGMPLSAFHIEGLDLLGGKYNLATRNIPAEYATSVQIVRNYHKRKIDADEPSNEVAMNIKLSKKAKFRPFGQEEAGAGCMSGGEDEVLGLLGLTGMLFTDDFQTICSAKAGNWKDYGVSDIIDHFGAMDFTTMATGLLGGFGGGRPPVGEYLHRRNGVVTLNAVKKTDSISSLRVNADYSYRRMTHDIASSSTYLSGDGERVTVGEWSSPLTEIHSPRMSAYFTSDGKNRYLSNYFKLMADMEHNDGDVVYASGGASSENNVRQRRRATSFEAENAFHAATSRDGKRLHLDSKVTFARTPSLRLSFCKDDENGWQTAQSTSFHTRHSTSFDVKVKEKVTLRLPVSLLADYDFVETLRAPSGERNRLHGWTLQPSFSPGFNWKGCAQRLFVSVSLPMSLRLTFYSGQDRSKLLLDPRLSMVYTLSPNSKLSASSSVSHSTGDLLDFLSSPIQTDYRTVRTASGVMGETSNWTSSAGWKFQMPLQFFTFGAEVRHTASSRNTLPAQSVDGIDIGSSSLFRDTRSHTTALSLTSSKGIPSLFSKLSANANLQFGGSEQAVNGMVMDVRSRSCVLHGGVVVSPIKWLEVSYDANCSWSRTSYTNCRNVLTAFSHTGKVSLFPVPALELSAGCDYMRHQIAQGEYRHISLFNASAQYKHRKFLLNLDLENLLDQRRYAYTVYDGVNAFSYDFGMCGRTVMARLTFKI